MVSLLVARIGVKLRGFGNILPDWRTSPNDTNSLEEWPGKYWTTLVFQPGF